MAISLKSTIANNLVILLRFLLCNKWLPAQWTTMVRWACVLLLCLPVYSEVANGPKEDSEQMTALIARWRTHILATINKGGKGVATQGSNDYWKLFWGGARYLPAVIEAYRTETDESVADCLAWLIYGQTLFGYEIYMLPCSDPVAEVKDMWQKEINPGDVSEQGGNSEGFEDWKRLTVWERRSKLLAWWDHRRDFLECAPLAERIHQVLGRSPAELHALNDSVSPRANGLCLYGIYGLPCFLDAVSDNNNPYIFSEFLRIMRSWEREDTWTSSKVSVVSHVWELDARFPTRESKLRYLNEWWQRKQQDYQCLPDLADALQRRFDAARNVESKRVLDPVAGFLDMVESDDCRNPLFLKDGERIEKVLRLDADVDGDGREEILLSAPQFIDGRERRIWHLYIQKNGQYEFLRGVAFSASTFYVGVRSLWPPRIPGRHIAA